MFCSPHGPFTIRTLARDLCTIIVYGTNCTHTSVQHFHFFANSWFSQTCSPLEQEAHFRFPDLSMPMQIQHVRVFVTTWASRFVFWPLHGPFKNRALARELCTLTVQVPHSSCLGPPGGRLSSHVSLLGPPWLQLGRSCGDVGSWQGGIERPWKHFWPSVC